MTINSFNTKLPITELDCSAKEFVDVEELRTNPGALQKFLKGGPNNPSDVWELQSNFTSVSDSKNILLHLPPDTWSLSRSTKNACPVPQRKHKLSHSFLLQLFFDVIL